MLRSDSSMSTDQATSPASTPEPDTWDGRHWRRAALRGTKITHAQRTVLLLLEEEFATWTTGGNIRPSCETIGRALGMKRQTVLGHLQALAGAGWLITTRPATKNAPAHYRLSYGEHAPVSCNSRPDLTSETPTSHPDLTSETPTSDVGNSDLADVGNSDTNAVKSFNAVRNPVSLSPQDVGNRATDEPPARERDDDGFKELQKAWPNRRVRGGMAAENALEAYRQLREHLTADDIMREFLSDRPNIDADDWLDAWLDDERGYCTRDNTAPTQTIDKSKCPDCHGSGLREDDDGNPIGRCAHDRLASTTSCTCGPCRMRADRMHDHVPEALGTCPCRRPCQITGRLVA